MNDNIVAQIRTTVPVYIGLVLSYLAREAGVVIDEQTSAALTVGFTGLVTSLYYAAVKALESRFPSLGWLLGNPRTPSYSVESEA